jgi:acetyltransferase-like isoleucine patch superfamily enzyme
MRAPDERSRRTGGMGVPTIKRCGIREDVVFGEDVVVYEPVNLYGCKIGDGVFVGPFVEIQSGARIGARTRIQSHAFICDGVTIGDDCFISHGAMFINDTFSRGGPAHGDRRLWKKTTIGNAVSIGTGAIILPVRICSGAVIGAGAVVTKDIEEPGVYAGNPAHLLRRLSGVSGL